MAASPQIIKKGRDFAAGCVEGLWKKVVKKVLKMDRPFRAGGFVSLTALRAEGCGGALRAQILKKPARSLPSFRPKRCGVEKSPPLMARAALRWEISRLRVSSERFPSAPIPTRSPARDDDVGEQHWTHLRCEGSQGCGDGFAANFIMPPLAALPTHRRQMAGAAFFSCFFTCPPPCRRWVARAARRKGRMHLIVYELLVPIVPAQKPPILKNGAFSKAPFCCRYLAISAGITFVSSLPEDFFTIL